MINRYNLIEVIQQNRGASTSQTTNYNYIGNINITTINNVSGAQPTGDSHFVTIPIPSAPTSSSPSSSVPLINDSVVPTYPTVDTNDVEYRKNRVIITDAAGNKLIYKYYPINRKVVKLDSSLSTLIRDSYYMKHVFTRIVDDLTGSIIYQFKHYISIIFPDINNGYKGDGAITRFYNKDDYNIIPNKKNKLYIQRINNLLDIDYDIIINQGFRHSKGNLADKISRYNENSFLYSPNSRSFEFLTDSKNIICLHLPKIDHLKTDWNKILWIMYRQPLDELIIGDASANRNNLIKFLKESFDVSLYNYYLKNDLGYWTNFKHINLDKNTYNLYSKAFYAHVIQDLELNAIGKHPINKLLFDIYYDLSNKYQYKDKIFGFILYNGKAEINIHTTNGYDVLTLNSTDVKEIKKEVNNMLHNSDSLFDDKFRQDNIALLIKSINTLEICEAKIANPLLKMKVLIENLTELKLLKNKAILNNLV